jgi:hypothetical protein
MVIPKTARFSRSKINTYYLINANPLKYTDPDGKAVAHGGKYPGWSEDAPQAGIHYKDWMDEKSELLGFSIDGARIDFNGISLRLWKGDYGKYARPLAQMNGIPFKGGAGGEIGFYDNNGIMIKGEQLSDSISLINSTMQLFSKDDNSLIAEYSERSGWVTAFSMNQSAKKGELFSANTFLFSNATAAEKFALAIQQGISAGANYYPYNGGEKVNVRIDEANQNKVIITFSFRPPK